MIVFLVFYFFSFFTLHLSVLFNSLRIVNKWESNTLTHVCFSICEFSEDFRFIVYLLNPLALLCLALYYDNKERKSRMKNLNGKFKLTSWEKEWSIHYRFLTNIPTKLNLLDQFLCLNFYLESLLPFRVFLYNRLFLDFSRTLFCFFAFTLVVALIATIEYALITPKFLFFIFWVYLIFDGFVFEYLCVHAAYSYISFTKSWIKRLCMSEEFEIFFFRQFSTELIEKCKSYLSYSILFYFYFGFIVSGLRYEQYACWDEGLIFWEEEVNFRSDNGLSLSSNNFEFVQDACLGHFVPTVVKVFEVVELSFNIASIH